MSKPTAAARGRWLPALSVALVALALLPSREARPARRPPPARPDRAMYFHAKAAQQRLLAPSRPAARRAEWERVAQQFRALVARYPQSAYCDDALLRTGDLYRVMSERFRSERDLSEAVRNYNALVSGYPSSSLAEQALLSAFEIEHSRRHASRPAIEEAARRYIKNFPDGPHASAVRAALRSRTRASATATPVLPDAPPPGLARVFDLRAWSGDATTRVAIFLERHVTFQQGRIENPDRLFVDLLGSRLHPNLESRKFPVGDGLLQQVRIAQYNPEVVRIVLDFKAATEQTVFVLDNPVRLIVDVRAASKASRAAHPRPFVADLVERRSPTPAARTDDHATPAEVPERSSQAAPAPPPPRASAPSGFVPAPRATALEPQPTDTPEDDGNKPPRRGRKAAASALAAESPILAPAEADRDDPPRGAEGRSAPTPQPNRSGAFSLVRQLGLGARRIVIDPGHGGHDPGTVGRSGLQEKDLVLDVALRLERLVRQRLHLDVVMTRRTDVFIPLEERTAIANAREADLFLSIHVNSSRRSHARGVETYYLSFAADAHAEEVAARENAISPATLKDLSGLVRAIMQNTKIEESRDFATNVQTAMVSALRPANDNIEDRGVRRAPFYVLLGANMPSVLAEIAFVSHREEEKLLRSAAYRQTVADGLLKGIQHYLDDLHAGRAQAFASDDSLDRPLWRASRR